MVEQAQALDDMQANSGSVSEAAAATSASARVAPVGVTHSMNGLCPAARIPDLPRPSPISTASLDKATNESRMPSLQQQSTFATATEQDHAPSTLVHEVYEKATGTWQYIVADPATSRGVFIDPVLDYDAATTTVSTKTADALLAKVEQMGYVIDMILETHAHADHITAASYLQARLSEKQNSRPRIGIGRRISQVQATFGDRYGMHQQPFDGVFDKLFDDDEVFRIGSLYAMAVHVPGHTPDHMAYRIGHDDIFTGDCIFHADLGTARADFPGGSAEDLFASGRKLLTLPDHVKIWSGHDYPSASRADPAAHMTVAEHKAQNKHLKDLIAEQDFISLRKERDATLAEPKLLHPSLQMNLRAGKLPPPTPFGQDMLVLPLKLGDARW